MTRRWLMTSLIARPFVQRITIYNAHANIYNQVYHISTLVSLAGQRGTVEKPSGISRERGLSMSVICMYVFFWLGVCGYGWCIYVLAQCSIYIYIICRLQKCVEMTIYIYYAKKTIMYICTS